MPNKREHEPRISTSEIRPRITNDPELAAKLERLRIPYKLVSKEEFKNMGSQVSEEEIAEMEATLKREQEIGRYAESHIRVTSDPELAATLKRLGIAHKLVSKEELRRMANKPEQSEE